MTHKIQSEKSHSTCFLFFGSGSIGLAQIDLAAGPLGILDDTALRNVIKAIGYVIKSDCKPL